MQSFTNLAYELNQQADETKLLDYIPPYTSCLLEQEAVICRKREMEISARESLKQFQAIVESGFPLPTSSFLRKAIISVKKESLCFPPNNFLVLSAWLWKTNYIFYSALKQKPKTMLSLFYGQQILMKVL